MNFYSRLIIISRLSNECRIYFLTIMYICAKGADKTFVQSIRTLLKQRTVRGPSCILHLRIPIFDNYPWIAFRAVYKSQLC